MSAALLSVRNLSVVYETRRGPVQAVREFSLELAPRETLFLIGESGSGKSTFGLTLVQLLPEAAAIRGGEALYQRDSRSYDLLQLSARELRRFRWRECAMVFQSALNAFNPVLRVWPQFRDTALAHGHAETGLRERVHDLLRFVQLEPARVINAYPHELSGGMRQRVLLALSLLLEPAVVILDEPTTALDILTQRTVLELLRRLKEERDFAMLFITHDLSLAAELADRVATMYAGRIVETGGVRDLFYNPCHPYTLGLIKAVPTVTGPFQALISIPGSPPDLVHLPAGCKFHPRCPYASDRCRREEPPLHDVAPGHQVACFHWEQVAHDREARAVREILTTRRT